MRASRAGSIAIRGQSDARTLVASTASEPMADTKKTKPPTEAPAANNKLAPPSMRWEDIDPSKTVKMAGAPGGPIPRPSLGPNGAKLTARGVELFVVDETQLPGGERKAWRAAEIWTKRRVYGLDSTFKCFEILDRETGRPALSNERLGARLGGGRLREKEVVKFSYPYPLPGMEAMFMKGKKHGYTSAVERMIVRIRVLHTSADEALPTWDEIASRWSELPPRAK
jgi:hypothetical protein